MNKMCHKKIYVLLQVVQKMFDGKVMVMQMKNPLQYIHVQVCMVLFKKCNAYVNKN